MGARFFARVNCFFVVKLLLSIHFQYFSSDIMLDFFLSSDKEHVCYMILLSFLELTSYKIAVADLLLSWQSHRKQRAVSSVHCIPEVSSQFLKKRSDGTSPAANPTGAKATDACTSSQVVCTLTDSETTDRGARRALLFKHAKYLLRTQAVHALRLEPPSSFACMPRLEPRVTF
jgi:hypothetical protein